MDIQEVYAVAKEILPPVDITECSLEPIERERTRSFILHWGEKDYNLKVGKLATMKPEAKIISELDHVDFVPRYYSVNDGFLITDHILGKKLLKVTDDVLSEIISTSKKLAAVDTNSLDIPNKGSKDHIDKIKRSAKRLFAKPEYNEKLVLDIKDRLDYFLTHTEKNTFSYDEHLIHSNPDRGHWLFAKDNTYLVDWEGSFIGDFAHYVANLIGSLTINPYLRRHNSQLRQEQKETIISQLKDVDEGLEQRVQHYLPYIYFDYMIWYTKKELDVRENPDNYPQWKTEYSFTQFEVAKQLYDLSISNQ